MKALVSPITFPIIHNSFQEKRRLISTDITTIIAAMPMFVDSYSELIDLTAKLAYANRKYILFFRGQDKEYKLGKRFSTIYPTFYRDLLQQSDKKNEIKNSLLKKEEEIKWKSHNQYSKFQGVFSISDNKYIRWALLQHYQVCSTPLLDLTQSLHVAATFALLDNNSENLRFRTGIIYVFALPWPSKNYHTNKEEDLYLVRLAGITPPDAKRPYRQEAFAVMSKNVDLDITTNIEKHDFAQRLVGKFEINNSSSFWGKFLNPLPESLLAPKDDEFFDFMTCDFNNGQFIR